jgi:hydroxyacylglutathione hydrolase
LKCWKVSGLFFRQIKRFGDNFSYVFGDDASREAAVVDPSFNADAIIELVREHGLNVKFVLATHGHLDHVSGVERIKSVLGGKVVAHRLCGLGKDVAVDDGDVLDVGKVKVKVIFTPGHTPDGVCFLVDGKLFTGDTLFVGECGRTDLPGGSAVDLYHSLFGKLLKLGDDVEVCPGHDYGASPSSTIGVERRSNYTLENRSVDEFVEFMSQP